MKSERVYEDDLEHCGLRKTRYRMMILQLLDQSKQPMTAEQLFNQMKKQNKHINLSTIYRNLDLLVDQKLITRLSLTQDGRALHEYNRQVHRHYLVCLGCGIILPIDGCPLESYSEKLEQETHYHITGHRLDLYGYCPTCRTRHDTSGST